MYVCKYECVTTHTHRHTETDTDTDTDTHIWGRIFGGGFGGTTYTVTEET